MHLRFSLKLLLLVKLLVSSGLCIAGGIEVKEIVFDGVSIYEAQTNDPEILGVSVQPAENENTWYVFLPVAEFVRDEPLETKFRRLIDETLTNIAGVKSVEEADREVWYVEGKVSGEELVIKTVEALNSIYPELNDYINSF